MIPENLEIVVTCHETARETFTAYNVNSEQLLVQLIQGARRSSLLGSYEEMISVAEQSERWPEVFIVFRDLARALPGECEKLLGPLATVLLQNYEAA
jgi:hypothetical protein